MDYDGTLTTAIDLMRRALGLLDENVEDIAACHLQHAIDIANRQSTDETQSSPM